MISLRKNCLTFTPSLLPSFVTPLALALGLLLCSSGMSTASEVVLESEKSEWRTLVIARDIPRQNIGAEIPDWGRGSVPLPEDWTSVDFNDRDWARSTMPLPPGVDRWGRGGGRDIGHLALRNHFKIDDPAAAGSLRLNLAYRGGVVVYLNGTEILRQHLAEGDGVADMLAEPYGKSAWFVNEDDEKPIHRDNAHNHAEWLNEHRLRWVRDLELPTAQLRAGTNVLSILVNASASPMDHTDRFQGANWPRLRNGNFAMMGLAEAELKASGSGVTAPPTSHPDGVHIWASSPLYDLTPESFPSMGDTEASLRLVGPRGGQASAPIVVSSTQPIAAPKLSLSQLQGPGGSIEAGSIRLLHASRVHRDAIGAADGFEDERYNILGTSPSPEAPHQPVWVLVDIPADAAPGTYTGTATVEAGGQRQEVPVELTVGAYQLPDQREFVTLTSLMHHAENVAYRYDIELWSDAHFTALEPVLELLAGVGNNVLYLPVARRGVLNSRETIVQWEERGGRLQPNFDILRRYLTLYDRIVGEPRFLGLQMWDVQMGSRDGSSISVTKRNADGTREEVDAPWYTDDGAVEFWKPAVDGIRALVRELGWSDNSLLISLAHDRKPTPDVLTALDQITSGMPWNLFSHARGYNAPWDSNQWEHQGMKVGFHEEPWSPRRRSFSNPGVIGGWNHIFPQASGARFHFHTLGDEDFRTAAAWRNLPTGNVAGGRGGGLGNRTFWGYSRFWFDYWPVPRQGRDGYGPSLSRQGYGNLIRNTEFLLAPGKDGPQPTVSYQQIREGLQETEARLVIEIAMATDELRGRLGAELEERARKVIRDNAGIYDAGKAAWGAAASLPWRSHAAELFEVAGAVQQALGSLSLRQYAPIGGAGTK